MLSKKTFVEAIEKLKAMEDAEQALYDASDSCVRLYEWKPYSDLLEIYVKLLEEAMKVEIDERYGSDISYFIYELEFGKKWKPNYVTDSNGNSIDMSTAEKLYDYLVSERAEE